MINPKLIVRKNGNGNFKAYAMGEPDPDSAQTGKTRTIPLPDQPHEGFEEKKEACDHARSRWKTRGGLERWAAGAGDGTFMKADEEFEVVRIPRTSKLSEQYVPPSAKSKRGTKKSNSKSNGSSGQALSRFPYYYADSLINKIVEEAQNPGDIRSELAKALGISDSDLSKNLAMHHLRTQGFFDKTPEQMTAEERATQRTILEDQIRVLDLLSSNQETAEA